MDAFEEAVLGSWILRVMFTMVLAWGLTYFLLRYKAYLSVLGAGLLSLLISFAALSRIEFGFGYPIHPYGYDEWLGETFRVGMVVLVPIVFGLAGPFLVMLYQKWIRGKVTEEEKVVGWEGVRAWLSPWNVLWIIGIAVSMRFAFSHSILSLLFLGGSVLCAYPFVRWAMAAGMDSPDRSSAGIMSAGSEEREKVLNMIESGKITAEEGADLINALPRSDAGSTFALGGMSVKQKIILVGALLVLVGFFLPWLNISLTVNDFDFPHSPFSDPEPSFSALSRVLSPQQLLFSRVQTEMLLTGFSIPGSSLRGGMGWFILIAAVASATLQFVRTKMKKESVQMICLLVLGAGGVLLVYAVASAFRFIAFGLVLTLVGYLVLFAGVLVGKNGFRVTATKAVSGELKAKDLTMPEDSSSAEN